MSASDGGDNPISRLKALSDINTSLGGSVTKLILLPIAAIFFGISDVIEAGADVVVNPLDAFAIGLGDVVESILGDLSDPAVSGAADIISAGGAQSALDVTVFGIGAFPLAIAVAGVGAFILARLGEEDETGNFIPFLPFDIPIIGRDEDED